VGERMRRVRVVRRRTGFFLLIFSRVRRRCRWATRVGDACCSGRFHGGVFRGDIRGHVRESEGSGSVTITDLCCAYLLTYLCPRSDWDLPHI
jgi:hypothetical protein